MKRFYVYLTVFVVLFICPSLIWGQTVKQDSTSRKETVQQKDAKKDKKIRINLPRIGKNRDSTGKPGLFLKAKELIESVEIPPIREIIQSSRSEEYANESELDSSIQAIEEVLFQLEETQDTQGVIELHNKRGSVHQLFGNKSLARESYQEVLKGAERNGDMEKMAEANFNIGNTYLSEKRYRRAQSHLLEALGIYQGVYQRNKDQKVKGQLSLLNINLGKCAQGLGQKPEALFYFDEASRLSEELEDKSGQEYVLTNMGDFYKLENDLPKAIEYHGRALARFDSSDNNIGRIAELNNIGTIYMEQGNVGRADSFFQQARVTAERINSKEQLKETYLSLSQSAEKKGQQSEALSYFQQYQILKDSLSEIEKEREIKLMESSYLAQKRELDIQRLEKNQAQQKNIQNITFGSMGLLVLLTFGFWQRLAYQRKKKETKIEQQRVAKLQKLDQLKDQFLANTSHELRTPLNGIIGLAESLSEGIAGVLPREAVDDLNIIAISGRRLSGLVNDILDFSKMENNDLQLQLRSVDLYSATDVVLSLCKPLVAGKSIQLLNEVPRDICLANADENRLQQILHNLLGNAIKFTEEGFVKVSAVEEGDFLTIQITDTGIGIPEDQLEAIFQPFEQGDGSIAREYGGAGLGLSISRQLVALHGGTISAHSEKGEGACFTFSLPRSQASRDEISTLPLATKTLSRLYDNEAVAAMEPQTTTKEASLKPVRNGKIRILAVDDEPINLKVLNNQLRLQGYEVIKASNGQQALKEVLNGQRFDLVLLDIMMPKMSGYEVCHQIRSSYTANELPIVMLTAKNRVSDLVEGFDAGANDYITKPFSRDELISRIKIHLGLNRVHRASGKFIPSEFLQSIGRKTITDVKLGDQAEKVVTVFFSDIRDYTTLAENMTPTDNFQFVQALNARMGPIIQQNSGFVNQYLGDAIMAIFTQNAEDALRSAISMQKTLHKYNEERESKNRKPIKVGMGMHTGPLIMGIIGDEKRMDAATIADTVNTASRIESLTKHYGASILISEASLQNIENREAFHLRRLGPVQVKGRKEPIDIFECFDGDDPKLVEKKLATLALFERGLAAYYDKQFSEAVTTLNMLLEENPADAISHLFLQRALHYHKQGVADDWMGVEEMQWK